VIGDHFNVRRVFAKKLYLAEIAYNGKFGMLRSAGDQLFDSVGFGIEYDLGHNKSVCLFGVFIQRESNYIKEILRLIGYLVG
jgi:hypothetical protein